MSSFKKLLACSVVLLVYLVSASPVAAKVCSTQATRVTPHMEIPIEPDENLVFCSTFQIAWNLMRNDVIKEDIQLEKPLELVRVLNRGLTTKTDIAEEDYLAMVGYGADEIADKVNRALRRKFGDDAPTVDDEYNQDDTILAYAFLLKELQFENAFEDFRHPLTFYGRRGALHVEAFGIDHYTEQRHRKLRDQVDIIDYRNQHDFVIRLTPKAGDDEIILAQVKPGSTLLETFEKINGRIADSGRHSRIERLGKEDVLQIPKFDLSIDHRYSSLLGLHLLNKGFEDYFVAEAKQDIRFRLDECGATVKSEAIFALKKGGAAYKILIFNRPFMLYLKKKDAEYPYLVMWVENDGLMVKSD